MKHEPADTLMLPSTGWSRLVNALLVFTIGIPLLLFPEQTDRYFAWAIRSPLTAVFLGGCYWASCVRELMDARERTWASARVALPGIGVFSTLMLVTTLLHLDRFHFNSPHFIAQANAWTWLIVYALVPVAVVVVYVRQQRREGVEPPRTHPLPLWAVVALFTLSAGLIALGTGLFVAPEAVAQIWPWALTPLTTRATASWLVGIGVVVGFAARAGDVRRIFSNTVFLVVLCVLQFVALLLYPSEVGWSSPQAIVYLLVLTVVLVAAGALCLAAYLGTRVSGSPPVLTDRQV